MLPTTIRLDIYTHIMHTGIYHTRYCIQPLTCTPPLGSMHMHTHTHNHSHTQCSHCYRQMHIKHVQCTAGTLPQGVFRSLHLCLPSLEGLTETLNEPQESPRTNVGHSQSVHHTIYLPRQLDHLLYEAISASGSIPAHPRGIDYARVARTRWCGLKLGI